MSHVKSPPAWFAWTVATVVLGTIGAGLWFGGMHYAHSKMGMSGMDDSKMKALDHSKMKH